MAGKAIAWKLLVELPHKAISIHFGQNRGSGNRRLALIAANDGFSRVRQCWVKPAIYEDVVRDYL